MMAAGFDVVMEVLTQLQRLEVLLDTADFRLYGVAGNAQIRSKIADFGNERSGGYRARGNLTANLLVDLTIGGNARITVASALPLALTRFFSKQRAELFRERFPPSFGPFDPWVRSVLIGLAETDGTA